MYLTGDCSGFDSNCVLLARCSPRLSTLTRAPTSGFCHAHYIEYVNINGEFSRNLIFILLQCENVMSSCEEFE